MVGYNPLEFGASVVLRDGSRSVYLSAFDWRGLNQKFTLINNYIAAKMLCTTQNLLGQRQEPIIERKQRPKLYKITPSIYIYIYVKEYDVMVKIVEKHVQTSLKEIHLTHQEFIMLYSMKDFLNSVVQFAQSTEHLVKEYFDNYLQKCIQNKVSALDSATHFPPISSSNAEINYSRLFYETPIFCKDKIFYELNKL